MTTSQQNDKRTRRPRRAVAVTAVGAVCAALAACSGSSLPSLPSVSDLNPFQEKEQLLPGKRVSVLPESKVGVELASASQPVLLPFPRLNSDWPQPGGTASNAPGHLQFEGSARKVWSADIGSGSSSRVRLTSGPIVAEGRVFTMDAQSVVSAYSASSGSLAWRYALVPEHEDAGEGFGGGLAFDGGRLFAATGFGTVVGIDPARGKKIWETKLGVPLKASPMAANGQVFVVATDGRAFNLNATDGAELWAFRGLPQTTGLVASPSPALGGNIVIFPFPNGDVVGVRVADGVPIWSESVASTTTSSAGAVSDASRPVVAEGRVYAVGHSGSMVAAAVESGERLWSAPIAGIQSPAVAGNFVFVVDLDGQLVALDSSTGQAIWSVKLAGSKTWAGPTLASGKLWLTSASGQLVSVDAASGKMIGQVGLGGASYLAPIIANGTLYVLTDAGQLIAFR